MIEKAVGRQCLNHGGVSMRNLIVAALAVFACSGTANAQGRASVSASAICNTGQGASGPAYAHVQDSTDTSNPYCHPLGVTVVNSLADGPQGVLGGDGWGTGQASGSWDHGLISPIKFLSDAAETTVTLHVSGSVWVEGQNSYDPVSAWETLYVWMSGDLGGFQTGPIQLYTSSSGSASQVLDRYYSFKFSGPEADISLRFFGWGSFQRFLSVPDPQIGTSVAGGGGGRLTIDTSAGSVIADGHYFGAVPEPATWAAMLLGFSLIGTAMRFRTNPSTIAVHIGLRLPTETM